MDDKKTEMPDYEDGLTEEDISLAKERFVTTANTSEVTLTPQCVGCKNNGGIYRCSAYGKKPDQYISNQFPCPKRSE